MTVHINHAVEALKIIHEVSHDEAGQVALELLDETERWVYEVSMHEAQVYATLALAEQQRIANLIALADHSHARFGNYAGEAGGMGGLFSYGETPESNMRIRDDIKRSLGL